MQEDITQDALDEPQQLEVSPSKSFTKSIKKTIKLKNIPKIPKKTEEDFEINQDEQSQNSSTTVEKPSKNLPQKKENQSQSQKKEPPLIRFFEKKGFIVSSEEEQKKVANLTFEEARLQSKEFEKKTIQELLELYKKHKIKKHVLNLRFVKKQALIQVLLREINGQDTAVYVEGIVEVLNEGYAFLRSPFNSYVATRYDIYISPQRVIKNNLRTGDSIIGQANIPQTGERFYSLKRFDFINDMTYADWKPKIYFDQLVPIHPFESLKMEHDKSELSTRLMDFFIPLGKGQRALIVAPPRAGKTVLLQNIANAISKNYPESTLLVLLIDERPEEVTEMQRNVQGEVFSSTFDSSPDRHVQVANMVIERARRMVENGKDVVVLLDSITRLARAHNVVTPHSGKILSGGVDVMALQRPKRVFGSARKIENGGSLTIVATALVETGSRMDEVIFEEFKGTGNMELVLDRKIAEKRIWPAIDLFKSGTRKEELLLSEFVLPRIWVLRRYMQDLEPSESIEFLISKLNEKESNEDFLNSMND